MVQRADWIQLDVLANGGLLCIRRKTISEVDRTEMLQLPPLTAIRIRGPFQRDCEPQGQYGIETANEVSHDSGLITGQAYYMYTLEAWGRNGQL